MKHQEKLWRPVGHVTNEATPWVPQEWPELAFSREEGDEVRLMRVAACCHGIVGREGAAAVQTGMHRIKGSLGGWEQPFVIPVLTAAM